MARPTRLIRAFPRPEAGGVDYDNDSSGLDADTIQEAIDEIVDLIGTGPFNFELKDEGGEPEVDDHGTAGATETVDATDGNHHRLTLDQDCTITVNSFPDGSIIVAVYQDGTGGWGITWSGVDFGSGDDQPDLTAGSLTFFLIISEDSNRYGFKAGGGGGSVLTIEDEGTPLPTAATSLDFVGSPVDATGSGAAKTITIRSNEPVTHNPGSGPDLVYDGDDLVMQWVD